MDLDALEYAGQVSLREGGRPVKTAELTAAGFTGPGASGAEVGSPS